MTKEMEFFIYLIENYSNYKGINAKDIMEEIEKFNLTDMIYNMYERYHTERIENAYNDIDELIKDSKNKQINN